MRYLIAGIHRLTSGDVKQNVNLLQANHCKEFIMCCVATIAVNKTVG